MSINDDHESNFSGTVRVHESLPEDDVNFYYMRLLNFTQYEQVRKNGRLVMHVVLSCYCFWMLAIICDEYFIVSIHIFCQSITNTNFKIKAWRKERFIFRTENKTWASVSDIYDDGNVSTRIMHKLRINFHNRWRYQSWNNRGICHF